MVFKKFKQWLGIEGIKIEVLLPEKIDLSDGQIIGQIRFSTMHTQRIARTKVQLVEKYSHGRRKNKRMSEFVLGEVFLDDEFMVYPEEPHVIDFVLPYKLIYSNMDKNAVNGGFKGIFAKMAKSISGVDSEFRVEATSKVSGTALSPFDRKIVNFS